MKRLIVTIVVCWIGLCDMAAPLAATGNAEVFSLRGQRRSAVILRAEESTDHAATLAKYLKEIVGHDVAVIADPAKAPAGALKIHVGRDAYVRSLKLDFDALHAYGYYLKLADGDNMVIAGKYRGGTDYAVFDFLKRYGGYRSFMPGDLGEVIPHHPVIMLPSDLNLRENPSFMTLASGGGGVGGFTRAWRLTLQATHNLDEIYPPRKYMTTHPEYYGMMDGKREKAGPDDAWQPCVSNPDLPAIDVIVQREGDRNLDLATECLLREAKGDKQTIGAFWRKAAAQETDARLKALLLTQVYTAEAPAAPTQNLMPGPGQAPGAVQYSDADLARFDWHPAPGNRPGWYFYKYPPFRASLSWDRTETHSGKGSFAIGEDQMYACFIYGLPVTPGCRYRISFWVKENPQPVAKGEGLVIHWQNEQKVWTEAPDAKWLPDVGVENPGFKVPYPRGGVSEWRHVQATFSVPSRVSTAVLIFGARQQKPGESTWIDDVFVAKAFDPSFFAGGEK